MFVEKHRIEELHEPVDVYNFHVEDYHTYFVGESAVWVHNSECKVSTSRRDHILEGEGPNDPGHGPIGDLAIVLFLTLGQTITL